MKEYIENKSLIKSFCSEIEEQLKLYEIPPPKRKKKTEKKCNRLYKGKSEFHIAMHSKKALQNGHSGLGYLFFENMVKELKSCNIVDKNSLINLFNLSKVKIGNNIRLHQCRYTFSNFEWYKYRLNNNVKHRNLTIWKPNPYCVMVSIESKQDKELCNLELLSKGFCQIAERYNVLETFTILQLLLKKKCSNEIGINVLSSEEEIRALGFDFLPKTYRIYGLKFWFDKSNGKIELDMSFNCKLVNVIKTFNLIKEYKQLAKLYKKGILPIEPFRFEKVRLTRNLSLEPKRSYQKRDFYDLVKTFYIKSNWIFLRLT